MGRNATCFWVEPTELARESLRRFVSASDAQWNCERGWGHAAEAVIGELPFARAGERGAGAIPREDPRWPTHCPCGLAFRPDDPWELEVRRLWMRRDTGELVTFPFSPGAMWDAKHDGARHHGPDGICLMVVLPNGNVFCVDGDGRGNGWERVGTPPVVSAQPSIGNSPGEPGAWHGYLTEGRLEEL